MDSLPGSVGGGPGGGALLLRPPPQSGLENGEWPYLGGDAGNTRSAPLLDQINVSNFSDLEVAWTFKTDNLGTRPEFKLVGTP